MTPLHAPRAGEVLADRYRLERPLGKGGMGEVWAGTHVVTLAPVAVKLLSASVVTGGQARRRFLQEARTPAALNHPNVIRVIDAFVLDDGRPAIVMDRLEGEPLQAVLRRCEVMPLGALAAMAVPVVEAVAAAHAQGVVHRDLKPANLFLARRAGQVTPMVLDFGLVKLAQSPVTGMRTQPGVALGTPAYMAPEQARGEEVGPAADVWALGVVLYRALSGMLPIEGEGLADMLVRLDTQAILPLDELEPELPAAATDVVMAMLSRDPAERPTPVDVAERLRPFVDEAALIPLVAREPPTVTPLAHASLATAPTVVAGDRPTEVVTTPAMSTHPVASPGPATQVMTPPRGQTRAPRRKWARLVLALVSGLVALGLVALGLVALGRRTRDAKLAPLPKQDETSTPVEGDRGNAEGRPLRLGPFAPAGLYLWRAEDDTWVFRLITRKRHGDRVLEGTLGGLKGAPKIIGGESDDTIEPEGDRFRFALHPGDPDTLAFDAEDCVEVHIETPLPTDRIFLGRARRHPVGRRFRVCPP